MEQFGSLDPGDLGFDEAIDRDLAISSLHRRAIFDGWEVWRRHPDTYLNPGLRGVFGLFLHRLRPEAELVEAAGAPAAGRQGTWRMAKRNIRDELVPAILSTAP